MDIKGRQFPYISEQGARRYWENWVAKEDLEGLAEWESVFGRDFEARLCLRIPAGRPAGSLAGRTGQHIFWGDSYAFYSVQAGGLSGLQGPVVESNGVWRGRLPRRSPAADSEQEEARLNACENLDF